MSQFKVKDEEEEKVRITPYTGIQSNHHYVLPQKYIDVERGGSNIVRESSFSDTSIPNYMPSSPIDCETIEYQKQYQRLNRNLKLSSIFQLVLLIGILDVTTVDLCVDLK